MEIDLNVLEYKIDKLTCYVWYNDRTQVCLSEKMLITYAWLLMKCCYDADEITMGIPTQLPPIFFNQHEAADFFQNKQST